MDHEGAREGPEGVGSGYGAGHRGQGSCSTRGGCGDNMLPRGQKATQPSRGRSAGGGLKGNSGKEVAESLSR